MADLVAAYVAVLQRYHDRQEKCLIPVIKLLQLNDTQLAKMEDMLIQIIRDTPSGEGEPEPSHADEAEPAKPKRQYHPQGLARRIRRINRSWTNEFTTADIRAGLREVNEWKFDDTLKAVRSILISGTSIYEKGTLPEHWRNKRPMSVRSPHPTTVTPTPLH